MIRATLEFDKDKIASCIAEDVYNLIENGDGLEALTAEELDTICTFVESAVSQFFRDDVELD